MKVQRGDIVLVDFPYSNHTGSKIRPAMVDANGDPISTGSGFVLEGVGREQRGTRAEPAGRSDRYRSGTIEGGAEPEFCDPCEVFNGFIGASGQVMHRCQFTDFFR